MAKKITIRGIIGLSEKATPEHLEDSLGEYGDISVTFASPGGFVSAGIEMSNMIRAHAGRTTAIITGQAASMASYMPMMFDHVIAYDNTVFMIHNPYGMIGGDYRDADKFSTRLRGIRDLLASAYSTKSGKSVDEIKQLMDDETFFYGQEIVDNGFADELIKSDSGPQNKTEAMALAQTEIQDCQAKMKDSEEAVKTDFERAAAYLKSETHPPARAGKPKEEAQKMETLTAFLAANPAAKADHDAIVLKAENTARTEGETAGTEKMKATITAVAPFLNSEDYPAVIGETALNVLKGEDSIITLKASVAAVDAVNQKAETDAAAAETDETGETPGTGQLSAEEKSEAEFQARMGGGK